MKIEMHKTDIKIVKTILEEVLAKRKNKIKEMQKDKNCSLEIYDEHLDSVNSLGIILEGIKEQL